MSNSLSTVFNINSLIQNSLKSWVFQEKVYGKKGKNMVYLKRNKHFLYKRIIDARS
jgi:hypothetical protein